LSSAFLVFVVNRRLRHYNDVTAQAPNLSDEKGELMDPKHTAIVLIEYQNDFTSEARHPPSGSPGRDGEHQYAIVSQIKNHVGHVDRLDKIGERRHPYELNTETGSKGGISHGDQDTPNTQFAPINHERLQRAYRSGELRVIKRIHACWALSTGSRQRRWRNCSA